MNLELIKAEHKIISKIFIDNRNTVHFIYGSKRDKIKNIEVYTYNGNTEQTFLFYKATGETFLGCLENTLQHLHDIHLGNLKSFTIRWKKDDVENTSYFYATSEEEAIEKCKNIEKDINILYVRTNPIS